MLSHAFECRVPFSENLEEIGVTIQNQEAKWPGEPAAIRQIVLDRQLPAGPNR